MNTLKAEKRSMDIKAKKLRREGYVTGIVFGRDLEESIPLKIEKKEAQRFLSKNKKGSEAQLDVEGTKYDVLVKEVDYNAMSRETLEIDFQALVAGEKVHSVAEIVLLNHENVQGVIEQHLEEVAYKATKENLVEKIELDVSGMKPGDTIKVGDLDLAKKDGFTFQTDLDQVIVSVDEVHYEEPADDDDAAATTEA